MKTIKRRNRKGGMQPISLGPVRSNITRQRRSNFSRQSPEPGARSSQIQLPSQMTHAEPDNLDYIHPKYRTFTLKKQRPRYDDNISKMIEKRNKRLKRNRPHYKRGAPDPQPYKTIDGDVPDFFDLDEGDDSIISAARGRIKNIKTNVLHAGHPLQTRRRPRDKSLFNIIRRGGPTRLPYEKPGESYSPEDTKKQIDNYKQKWAEIHQLTPHISGSLEKPYKCIHTLNPYERKIARASGSSIEEFIPSYKYINEISNYIKQHPEKLDKKIASYAILNKLYPKLHHNIIELELDKLKPKSYSKEADPPRLLPASIPRHLNPEQASMRWASNMGHI